MEQKSEGLPAWEGDVLKGSQLLEAKKTNPVQHGQEAKVGNREGQTRTEGEEGNKSLESKARV